MWPFKKKPEQRRLEVRKNIPPGASLWRRFRQYGGLVAALQALVLFFGAAAMDVWPIDAIDYREGQYVEADIHARVTFKVPSQSLIDAERTRAHNLTPPTFRLTEHVDEIISSLKALPGRIEATSQPAELDESLRKLFTPEDMESWSGLADQARRKEYDEAVEQLRVRLVDTCFVRPDEAAVQEEQRSPRYVWLARGNSRSRIRIGDWTTLDDTEEVERRVTGLAGIFPPAIRGNIKAYLLSEFAVGIAAEPTYRYDPEDTQADIDKAIEAIHANPPYDYYEAGQLLVRRSRREAPGGVGIVESLGAGELELLRHEHEAFLSDERRDHPWRVWGRIGGRAAFAGMVTVLLCLYIGRYQPRIVRNHWRGLAIMSLLLLMLGINKLMVSVLGCNPHAAVLLALMAGMVITIAYDQRFALAMGVMLSVFLTLQIRGDIVMLLVLTSGLTASVFQLREIRTRSKLIEVSAVSAVIVLAVVWAGALAKSTPWRFALTDGMWAAVLALSAGFIVQGILPVIERIFRIATSMTLLEWCDASKPLLKRLAMEAPGTYNHSLQLGAMCEAAAEAVGARGLLARVGAYHHDIGKINKPHYFVENETASPSKHDKLSPAMSLLIIIGHVKDGIALAREYGLPPVLHEFIATHHGTTLVQYFYHAAAQQRKNGTDRAPDEVEFRYPGPKPQTREAAILMLADASESSVRAMGEPTPGRIENQVHTMVTRRLMDGQLDECELTLKQVHQIENSLVKSLCGIYHARIAYPTPAGQKPSAAERQATKRQEQQKTDQHQENHRQTTPGIEEA